MRGFLPAITPEFTTVEVYQAYADYHDMMADGESITTVAQEVLGTLQITYQGEAIDLHRMQSHHASVARTNKHRFQPNS